MCIICMQQSVLYCLISMGYKCMYSVMHTFLWEVTWIPPTDSLSLWSLAIVLRNHIQRNVYLRAWATFSHQTWNLFRCTRADIQEVHIFTTVPLSGSQAQSFKLHAREAQVVPGDLSITDFKVMPRWVEKSLAAILRMEDRFLGWLRMPRPSGRGGMEGHHGMAEETVSNRYEACRQKSLSAA